MTSTLDAPAVSFLSRNAEADLSRNAEADEFARIIDELTRRGFLTGGAGSAALLGLAACGSDDSSRPAAAPRGWRFTDDLGRDVTAPSAPARIVALVDGIAQALWSNGIHVVGAPVFPANYASLSLAGITAKQRAGIGNIGSAEINVEAVAALRPDLLIDLAVDGKLASLQDTPQLAKIAPVAGINFGRPLDRVETSIGRLAAALQIPAPAALRKARQNYQSAMSSLRDALAARPGLRVLVCTGTSSDLLVYTEKDWAFMQTLAEAGMQFTPAHGSYFQQVSWENAPGLQAGLIIYMSPVPPASPAWKQMPAVKAGHVAGTGAGATNWQVATYATYLTQINALITAVKAVQAG